MMNIWAKMITALRGGATEVGEAIVDTQALRILDQEVRDASDELRQSKDALAAIIARQKLAEEKCQQMHEQISKHEGYVTQALDKGEEALALEVAQKIADLENQLRSEESAAQEYAGSAKQLREAIRQAEQNIKRLKQQIDTVKATENVQRAQAAVAERHSGSNSKLQTAMESLERIKEKQAQKSAQMKAATELAQETNEDHLQRKLEKAGIVSSGSSAQDILERLKQKK
jgi:phage shock protein A